MTNCPECDNPLDIEADEVDEGETVVCDECETEYEVVSTEPLELHRIDSDKLDEDDDELLDEEEEED